MVTINYEAVVEAPLEVTFAYVDDLGHCDRWMFGINEVIEFDDLPHGVGKVYESHFHIKPVKLKSKIRVAERVINERIVTDSVGGFPVTSTWAFEEIGAEQTRFVAKVDYELPGGIAGKALGKALEPIVSMTLKKSDAELRKQIEEQYAASKK